MASRVDVAVGTVLGLLGAALVFLPLRLALNEPGGVDEPVPLRVQLDAALAYSRHLEQIIEGKELCPR